MNKFIIMQIKEERCAKPQISVGYNISKSNVDIKQFYDMTDLSCRNKDKIIKAIEFRKCALKTLEWFNEDKLQCGHYAPVSRDEIIKSIQFLENELIDIDKSDNDPTEKDIVEKLRDEHKYGWIRDLKKTQEQLHNKSFTKMCFSTNTQEEKRCNPETGYSYEIKQHEKLTNLLYKDALFNRFIAKCVNNLKIEETTLIEVFAEFLTMMSDCENRK